MCTHYHLSEVSSTLVNDSITGQKINAWIGTIDPQELLQELIPCMDKGPKEFSHRRRRVTTNVNNIAHEQIIKGKDVKADFSSLEIKEDNQLEHKQQQKNETRGQLHFLFR